MAPCSFVLSVPVPHDKPDNAAGDDFPNHVVQSCTTTDEDGTASFRELPLVASKGLVLLWWGQSVEDSVVQFSGRGASN